MGMNENRLESTNSTYNLEQLYFSKLLTATTHQLVVSQQPSVQEPVYPQFLQ